MPQTQDELRNRTPAEQYRACLKKIREIHKGPVELIAEPDFHTIVSLTQQPVKDVIGDLIYPSPGIQRSIRVFRPISEGAMQPLIELLPDAKARIRAREAKAEEQYALVRQACERDVASAYAQWGEEQLHNAVETARATMDSAALLSAQVVFIAHAEEYHNALRDPRELEPLLAQLREAVIRQSGEQVRLAVQSLEAQQLAKAWDESSRPPLAPDVAGQAAGGGKVNFRSRRMKTFLDANHPKFMYHATKPSVPVFSEQDIAQLGPEWSENYIPQRYPRTKYHRTGRTVDVKDAEAEAALGEGWGDSPAGPFGSPGADPLRWFDSWDLQSLSPSTRGRIRAGLSNAHADVIESSPEDGSRVRQASMKKVFDVFAEEYLAAGLLTETMLTESIPQMVYDAAVAGEWQTGALETNSACTLRFGHYWVPNSVPQMLKELFEAQVWRWRGKLDAKSDPAGPAASRIQDVEGPGQPEAATTEAEAIERAARRHEVVNPILKRKRWKPGRLATAAGVSKNSVYEYLDGTRATITNENREAIAQALDLKPEQLPD